MPSNLASSYSLRNLIDQMRDTPRLLDMIVEAHVDFIERRLTQEFSEGVSASGAAWPVAKDNRAFEPLVRSGALRDSFQVYSGGKGGMFGAASNWFYGVKSSTPYAAIQHFGGTLANGGVIKPHEIVPFEWPGPWAEGLEAASRHALWEWRRMWFRDTPGLFE